MKKLLLSTILALTILFANAETAQTVKVIRIYDGDTFTAITEQNETIRVRCSSALEKPSKPTALA